MTKRGGNSVRRYENLTSAPLDSVHRPHHPCDFAAERARVHHQSAADTARDALAELKPHKSVLDRLVDQHAELCGRSRTHLQLIELQPRKANAQVNHQPAHAAIADQQIGAGTETERRHPLAPRCRHRGTQLVLVFDREQHVGRTADPKRGKLGQRRAGLKPRAKTGA
jgi:hypothetical protein